MMGASDSSDGCRLAAVGGRCVDDRSGMVRPCTDEALAVADLARAVGWDRLFAAGAGSTSALMVKMVLGCWGSLLVMVILLTRSPRRLPTSNVTFSSDSSPGSRVRLFRPAVVQPQLVRTALIANGASPALITKKACSTLEPALTLPKWWDVSGRKISGCLVTTAATGGAVAVDVAADNAGRGGSSTGAAWDVTTGVVEQPFKRQTVVAMTKSPKNRVKLSKHMGECKFIAGFHLYRPGRKHHRTSVPGWANNCYRWIRAYAHYTARRGWWLIRW